MKPQADKASPAHVALHIRRQRVLGERAIADHDGPRWPDLLATGLLVACIGVGAWLEFWP